MKFRPVLAAGALMLTTSGPVRAHAILMSSTPPIAGRAAAGALAIILRYNSLIDVKRSRVTLAGPDQTGPDAVRTTLAIRRGGVGDSILTEATVRPGGYVLRWQVLATDGHITRGEVPFTAGGH